MRHEVLIGIIKEVRHIISNRTFLNENLSGKYEELIKRIREVKPKLHPKSIGFYDSLPDVDSIQYKNRIIFTEARLLEKLIDEALKYCNIGPCINTEKIKEVLEDISNELDAYEVTEAFKDEMTALIKDFKKIL